MNAWLPQASYPCGNFSDTSRGRFCQLWPRPAPGSARRSSVRRKDR